jgi:glc operon protein GlcG
MKNGGIEMYKRDFLDMEEASIAVKAVIKEASKDPNQPIAVAVVDIYGELIYYAKMDGSAPLFGHMAIKKAFTAARFQRSTREMGKSTKEWQLELASWDDDRNTNIPGGVSIKKPDGTLLGGIGVSGRLPDEDEELSNVGLKALKL